MTRLKVAIDANLSHRLCGALESMYGHLGYHFTHVSDLGGGDDEVWADVFRRFGGHLVLSGDVNIARRPHQQAAFIDAGLTCFFPEGKFKQFTNEFQVAYLMHAWKRIHDQIGDIPKGSCWQLPVKAHNGRLILHNSEFKRMKVPEEVLDECRKQRSA